MTTKHGAATARRAAIAAALFLATTLPGLAQADTVGQACMASGRSGATARLCTCLQNVADQTLGTSDRQMVAKLLRKPDMAQEVKMSTDDSARAFWDRYTAFGQAASASCS